jgi:hypothetical protein
LKKFPFQIENQNLLHQGEASLQLKTNSLYHHQSKIFILIMIFGTIIASNKRFWLTFNWILVSDEGAGY